MKSAFFSPFLQKCGSEGGASMNTNKVVMAGAGVMGASLAQVYALAGY